MSESLSKSTSLRTWPVLLQKTAESTQSTKPAASTSSQQEFQQILTTLFLGMGVTGGSDQSSGMGNVMAPLIMTLLEQLLSKQVASSPSTSSNTTTQASQVAATVVTPSAPQNEPHGMPIKGTLTQRSHPGHIALDFGAPVGTPVKATMDGKVIYSGWNNEGYGNLVIIENGPYRTYYAHLSKLPLKVGDKVTAGSVIAYSGNTGNSTGPHLHYEIRRNLVQIDPTHLTLPGK
jgi:murein DD-endopeptidase MepM/ murein hydrolase activator NlpD